ncbi:MarR family transcriptional regulator [Actinoplanes sp. NPDC051411]|uniref:MarR family winged helix-turn-helix transcriptional regulator n=1 Tax=Actinoplanes sp. NPDC051411 TaxID=3155522 RepID=UPI003422579F
MDALAEAAAVREGVQRLSRRLQGERSPAGLSLTKTSLLGHLARRGDLSPGELATADRLQPQSVTRVLAELERDGLVQRYPDPVDKRTHRIRLTVAGRATLGADMRQRDEWLAGAMASLTGSERAALLEAADILARLGES